MQEKTADAVRRYLRDGTLPTKFTSNKANFIAVALKYDLSRSNTLMRNNLPVVMESMREDIYKAFHLHSGRIVTWNRIKSR